MAFWKYNAATLLIAWILGGLAPEVSAQQNPVFAINRIPLADRAQLRQVILDPDMPVEARRAAIQRLRHLASHPGAKKLRASEFYGPMIQALRLRGKTHATVRETACEELASFGKEKGTPIVTALGGVLTNRAELLKVRTAAARSLGRMSGNPGGASAPLITLLNSEVRRGPRQDNIALVRTMIESLGHLGQERSRDTLLNVLGSSFPSGAKSAAQKALRALPPQKN